MRAELTRFSRLRVSARQTQSRKLDYHLVVEGSCLTFRFDHIRLIGSSAVEPHVTCDHRQHKRDRDCTLNDVRDPRAAVNTSPRMPGLTQCFLLLRWRLLIASTPRARDLVQSPMPAFLILYGADKLTVLASAVVVESRAQIPMRYAARVVGLHRKSSRCSNHARSSS